MPIHAESYGLDAFDDPSYLASGVRQDLIALNPFLPDASTHPDQPLLGLDVCHLQCHIGSDTLSLARAGARLVVGVDFSPSALGVAKSLADRHGQRAKMRWVGADVLDTRAAVTSTLGDVQFDLVYTTIGTIEWLNDLRRWARQVFALLKPGGIFYIHDSHPMMYTVDDERPGPPIPHYPYFATGKPIVIDEATSYSGEGVLAHPRTHTFPHPVSEIINALLDAGLRLERMAEGRTIPWRYSALMEEVGDGVFAWPQPYRDALPVTFTLIARKPAMP